MESVKRRLRNWASVSGPCTEKLNNTIYNPAPDNMKNLTRYFWALALLTLQSCGIYSFSGADIGNAQTFQVNQFRNTSAIVEPGIDRTFTLELQDIIQSQT